MRAYLDWNATARPLPEVIEAVARAQRECWGNQSSAHAEGRRARACVEDAREIVASLLGRSPRDVFFTSGGTESNNIAVRSLGREASLVLASRVEHPSVVRAVEELERCGIPVCWLRPSAQGGVEVEAVEQALDRCAEPSRALVCLQAANHETGVLQPTKEVIALVQRFGGRVHVDAVQAVGKVDSERWALADTVAITAHKIRGPKGIGALGSGRCVELRSVLLGGEQEYGLRPGTVCSELAAGFGVAAQWALRSRQSYDLVQALRDDLEKALKALGGVVNGEGAERLGHVTNVSFEGLAGDELVAALDVEGVCVSSGSACSSGSAERSLAIELMVGESRARSAVRASLGETTSRAEVQHAIKAWEKVVLRAQSMDEVLLEVEQ